MVTTDHSPLDDRIYYKECLSLLQAGFVVHIICHADPSGKVFDMGGKKQVNKNGELEWTENGVYIHAIKRVNTFWQKLLNKILLSNYYNEIVAKGRSLNADVYHAHEPTSLFLAQKIAKGSKAKVIFDSHESWRGGSIREQIIKWICLPKLKYLITANLITRGALLHSNRALETEVIYNFAHPKFFPYQHDDAKYNYPIIVHDGYIPFNRGLKQMVEAIKLLKPEYPNIKFRILGETLGDEKKYLYDFIQAHNLQENIEETGWKDYLSIGKYLSDCSIGLITKTPTPNNILGGPAIKLFHYLHYGIAVIDNNLPESSYFLNISKSGISLKERNPQDLYIAIKILLNNKELLKKYGNNSLVFSQSHNWYSEEKKLIEFYFQVVLNIDSIIIR